MAANAAHSHCSTRRPLATCFFALALHVASCQVWGQLAKEEPMPTCSGEAPVNLESIAAMLAKLQTGIKEDVAKALEEQEKRQEEQEKRQEKRLESALDEQEKRLESALDEQEKRLESALDEQEKRLESALDEQEKRLESALDEQEKRLESALDEQEKRLESALDEQEKRLESRIDRLEKQLENRVHEIAAVLDVCSVPIIADGLLMAMTLFEVHSVSWVVTAGHNVPWLTNATSLRCGNGPAGQVQRHAVNLLVPSALQTHGAWHINASCDVALHPLTAASLDVFKAAGYKPCHAGNSTARVADETVLWAANQAAKLSTGRLIGWTDNGQCPGILLVDAPIRAGFSGSAAGTRNAWLGISVSEVNEKGVLVLRSSQESNLDASGDRLYGQIVPVSHILSFMARLQLNG